MILLLKRFYIKLGLAFTLLLKCYTAIGLAKTNKCLIKADKNINAAIKRFYSQKIWYAYFFESLSICGYVVKQHKPQCLKQKK